MPSVHSPHALRTFILSVSDQSGVYTTKIEGREDCPQIWWYTQDWSENHMHFAQVWTMLRERSTASVIRDHGTNLSMVAEEPLLVQARAIYCGESSQT